MVFDREKHFPLFLTWSRGLLVISTIAWIFRSRVGRKAGNHKSGDLKKVPAPNQKKSKSTHFFRRPAVLGRKNSVLEDENIVLADGKFRPRG